MLPHNVVLLCSVALKVFKNSKGNLLASIKAISISDRKGIRKENINSTLLLTDFGLENDAHGGRWHRQVSFLAEESIATMREKGLDVVAGNFAENITTKGIDLSTLRVGTHIRMGSSELVISQLGKICHTRCAIYHQAGDCVMPREGIFGVVKKGGEIKIGDQIEVLGKYSQAVAVISSKEDEKKFGERLHKLIANNLVPIFVRFDTEHNKEGGNFSAILEDITLTQQIPLVIVFDPTGSFGLSLAGLPTSTDSPNRYEKGDSMIYYCRSLEEVGQI